MLNDKVKILFLAGTIPSGAVIAEGWVGKLGDSWLEVRTAALESASVPESVSACMTEAGLPLPETDEVPPLSDEMLSWADLVITLCHPGSMRFKELPKSVRMMHWRLDDPDGVDDPSAINEILRSNCQVLRNQVTGMIEGMKMLRPG